MRSAADDQREIDVTYKQSSYLLTCWCVLHSTGQTINKRRPQPSADIICDRPPSYRPTPSLTALHNPSLLTANFDIWHFELKTGISPNQNVCRNFCYFKSYTVC